MHEVQVRRRVLEQPVNDIVDGLGRNGVVVIKDKQDRRSERSQFVDVRGQHVIPGRDTAAWDGVQKPLAERGIDLLQPCCQ